VVDVEALWAEAKPNEQVLVPCVVQDLRSRAVLMMAWVNKEALSRTLDSGFATFWSRSHAELWEKGATSGNRQKVVHVRLDCDGDTLLYVVEAQGPACHEGHDTCFTRRRVGVGWRWEPELVLGTSTPQASGNPRILLELDRLIEARAAPTSEKRGRTEKLVGGGNALQRARLKEKAEEAAHAFGASRPEKAAEAAADLLYHLAIAVHGRKIPWAQVFRKLEERVSVLHADDPTTPPSEPVPPASEPPEGS
jgi:phosphoribosyl-ATP pyrophosphohydrolase/phosphoribosyl-AMP cyclohydrolase